MSDSHSQLRPTLTRFVAVASVLTAVMVGAILFVDFDHPTAMTAMWIGLMAGVFVGTWCAYLIREWIWRSR